MKLNNELLQRLLKDYAFKFNKEEIEKLIEFLLDEIEELKGKNEELEFENKELENKIKDLEEDMQENYRPVPVAEQVAISDHDFI